MDTTLHILIVDDEGVILRTLNNYLTHMGYDVTLCKNGEEALKAISETTFDVALFDLAMPQMDGLTLYKKTLEIDKDLPVIIITGHGTLENAIQALRLGIADFITKPIKMLELDATLTKVKRLDKLKKNNEKLHHTIGGLQNSEYLRDKNRLFIGKSPEAQRIRNQIKLAHEAHVETILITGETGTGKEVVARNIHFMEYSEKSPFIAVNCPSITESLIESELFGHEKGAFTNATNARPGYFEMAENGTLFLDEIGDLAHTLQASLLRVLETRSIRRIGAQIEIPVNCKIIAATNVDLDAQIKDKKFRNDLFYRLNVFHIQLRPLREHPEDIMPLAYHFLERSTKTRGRHLDGFSPEAQKSLQNYDYPGNVRELRNLIDQATIFCQSGYIMPSHLNIRFSPSDTPSKSVTPSSKTLDRQTLMNALQATNWNRKEAARQLNITYPKLRYWIQKYNIQ